jgi:hypothetical protein
MKKYLPIIVALCIVVAVGFVVISQKNKQETMASLPKIENNLGDFSKQHMCARPPQFLQKLNIPQPVMIDLSQKRFKGIALLYGKNFKKVLHPKVWEQYAHFSTYAIDEVGNIYLIPTPFISIRPTTFNLQKNLYKLESKTGKISIFMHLDDVLPSASNPYGLNAITYDCEDGSLWVAAIDESDYQSQKGVIYHINLQTKEVLQRVEGFDVLSMTIVKSEKGKYLLVGSARDNGLYAYIIRDKKLLDTATKLLELPNPNEHIRKIKVIEKNRLELQSIPFSYALIAQTSKQDRVYYRADWEIKNGYWKIKKSKLQ